MKKIAVFGKPGSGKSTLSKAIARKTGIPLHQLDLIVYKQNGELVTPEVFAATHEAIITSNSWIVDGFGPLNAFYQRLEAADTLVYIDLPYVTSYWFVTKRLLKGLFAKPEGWPDGSSIVKGTIQSYKFLRLCPTFWNKDFEAKLATLTDKRSLHVIRSTNALNRFIESAIT